MVFFQSRKIFLSIGIGIILEVILSFLTKPNRELVSMTDWSKHGLPKEILRSCKDCHSLDTQWPWYSSVFPVSVWTQHHQEEAREELDLEEWSSVTPEKRKKWASDMLETIEEGEMPPNYYLIMHRDARITPEEVQRLQEWAEKL